MKLFIFCYLIEKHPQDIVLWEIDIVLWECVGGNRWEIQEKEREFLIPVCERRKQINKAEIMQLLLLPISLLSLLPSFLKLTHNRIQMVGTLRSYE